MSQPWSGPLPASPPGAPQHLSRDPAGAVLAPVLVADDDEAGRLLLCTYMRQMRLVNPVVACSDGDEAVDYLERVEAGLAPCPAVMILDLNMPLRSGLDVLRWRNGHPHVAAVPAVILTGSASRHEVDEAKALGVLSYIVKPVGFRPLVEVLRDKAMLWALVGAPPPAGSAAPAREESATPPA